MSPQADWEERVEIEFKDVDVAGTGTIAVQGELDRLLARVNGGRTIPPQEKSKLMQIIEKQQRVSCERLIEMIKRVIEDSPEFEHMLGAGSSNAALALPPNANPLVLSPTSQALVAWNTWVLFVSVYLLFEVPFHIAFKPVQREGYAYLFFSEAMDGMLLVDIVIKFFTAYVNKKSLLVYDLPHIAKHYLGTTFPLDIAAAFPIDLVVWAGSKTLGNATPWGFMAWLRCTKLLRVFRMGEARRAWLSPSSFAVAVPQLISVLSRI